MLCHEIIEGRVYRVDWGYPSPVMVISNPSQAQSRTLVEVMLKREPDIYLRGVMVNQTVYVWNGSYMTHDDVLGKLLPDVYPGSDDLSTFEIANYTVIGLGQLDYHPAKCTVLKPGNLNPEANRFVRNVMAAIDAA